MSSGDCMAGPWYRPLADLVSKGSITDPIGGLAGLAAARAEHCGQFFTPISLVALMWQVTGLFAAADEKLSIFDNSFGSGRMFAFATSKRHKLCGIEVDRALAEKVQAATEAVGFDRRLDIGSLDEYRVKSGSFNVGLINPPFSLTIDTPYVEAAECNAYGTHGPKSSALSHVFAVWQALKWCRHVAAVIPASFGAALLSGDLEWASFRERLVAVYKIPKSAFVDEGANVETVVAVFGPEENKKPVRVETVRSLAKIGQLKPLFELEDEQWHHGRAETTHVRADASEPAITLPFTGDSTVRVVHDGRKIGLRFACGNTQGRVLNALYREVANGWRNMAKGTRRAEGIEWAGQGWFDLENYLAQADPLASFGFSTPTYNGGPTFLGSIRAAGGVPEVDLAIGRLLQRKARRQRIERTPFRHTAFVNDGGFSHWLDAQDEITGTCCKPMTIGSGWSAHSRNIEVGDVATFKRSGTFRRDDYKNRKGPCWSATIKQFSDSYTQADVLEHFDVEHPASGEGWAVVHEGLAAAFPLEVERTRNCARSLGLDHWCSWGYQFDDLCEVSTKRRGIIAWDMGLGKARLALALCMLGGERNLITVEAHLVKEMTDEIGKLSIPRSDWQVITKPENARALRKINIIAYSRLKAAVGNGQRKTIADILRRRIHTHVCDEGHILRNHRTQQTQAVIKVSAKVRYLMSGTPIANYPRDMLPLVQWAAGDGTAVQAFGEHRPYMREENLRDIDHAPNGTDVFRKMFVVTEWVTNEFADDLRSGAKREIPEIADVRGFRAFVAPWVKRRVLEEPDVALHVNIPKPDIQTTLVEWDRRHLALYVKVAREFVDWYKDLYDRERKGVGLIAILAKMQAVQRAANFPAFGVPGQAKFPHVTSKQRHAVKRLRDWTGQGHKSILLCENPDTVDWFAAELAKHEIDAVRFHGKLTIANRIKDLDKRFRFGNAPVLLATKHTLQTGYNIHQANRVLVYDRTWTPKTEQQACARVLRPQQTRDVVIEFVHYPGSIDEYQAQMVAAKAKAVRAGLDYGSEEKSAEGFLHLETILGRFVEDFEQRFGITADELIAEVGVTP